MSSKALSRVANILFMLFSLALILLLTYFFGHKLLSGGLMGNDSPNAFGFIVWLDKYFPKIPLWYPLQGTGVSFVQGYQVFPFLAVVWLHRLGSLSLIQSFELLSFLSVFLSALGLYFLGWARFKSQTVGLLAAIFFLLAPANWVWTTQAGFFTSAFSMMFFAPAFLFVDWYFEYVFESKEGAGKRTVFIAAVLFLSLSLLSHFATFSALFIIACLYLFVYALFRGRGIVKNFLKAAFSGITLFGTTLALSAFWFFSFYTYSIFANWDGSGNANPNFFPPINLNTFLTIPTRVFEPGMVWTFSFPLFIWVLSLAAIVLAIFHSKKVVALGITGAFVLYASISTGFYVFVSQFSPFLANAFSPRIFWVAYGFLGPILAAYALWIFPKLIFERLTKSSLFKALGAGFSLVLALILIVLLRKIDLVGGNSFARYGPVSTYLSISRSFDKGEVYGGGLDLRDVWARKIITSGGCFNVRVADARAKVGYVDTCCYYQVEKGISDLCETAGAKVTPGDFFEQLKPKNWPSPVLSNDNPFTPRTDLENWLVKLPRLDNLRIDISPMASGALLERVGILRQDISIINVYTFQLSLNHVFWANSQGVFYSEDGREELYKEPEVLSQEAKYFGVNDVLLGQKDPKEKYEKAGWQIEGLDGGQFLARPPFTTGLFELDNKPSVLVLGQQKFKAYESFYNTSIQGGLPFDKAYVVMGGDFVDDYSLATLKKFDVLVLQAYNYHSSQKAWNLLETYVKEGGSLFIDTGWQYKVPDWQLVKTPNFIPLEELEWKSLSMQGSFSVPDGDFRKGFGVESFSPLIWKEKPWGVSTSKKVKSWASVVLSYDDYPVVVKGKLGEGKVVWSGMNIISHAHDAKNKKEVEFMGKIFDYLLSGREKAGVVAEMKRAWPDKVEIELTQDLPSGGNLFFREAYSPNWEGHISFGKDNEKFEVYRGGPGLIYARLPALKKGNKIILEYKMLPSQMLGYPVSFVTFLFILAFIGDGILNKGELFGNINSSLKRILNFPINRMKRAWERDEER